MFNPNKTKKGAIILPERMINESFEISFLLIDLFFLLNLKLMDNPNPLVKYSNPDKAKGSI